MLRRQAPRHTGGCRRAIIIVTPAAPDIVRHFVIMLPGNIREQGDKRACLEKILQPTNSFNANYSS